MNLSARIANSKFVASPKAWRAVEAQHLVATLRLTDGDLDAQAELESILDRSKPPLPLETAHLDYLLATPFRYRPAGHGSRFRAPFDPGVLYGAKERRTACAEAGYWRWRFVQDSAGLRRMDAAPQTLFQFGATGTGIALHATPWLREKASWTNPNDYTRTQQLAKAAREAQLDWLQYSSVRDPDRGECLAVFNPACFKPKRPITRETWYLTITEKGAVWQHPSRSFRFDFVK